MGFFKKLSMFLKTEVLGIVVYNKEGKPIDCPGLRYEGAKPFGKDTTYHIVGNYDSWAYLGRGKYTNGRSYVSDIQNPYYRQDLDDAFAKIRKIAREKRGFIDEL